MESVTKSRQTVCLEQGVDDMVDFIFEKDGVQITAVMTMAAGYDYARRNGYTVVSAVEQYTEPTEEDDVNAMLVDHEYRITLIELGLIEW